MQSKPGKHGTLYAFRITYRSDTDPDCLEPQTCTSWAYNKFHAALKFNENENNVIDGWILVDVSRLP